MVLGVDGMAVFLARRSRSRSRIDIDLERRFKNLRFGEGFRCHSTKSQLAQSSLVDFTITKKNGEISESCASKMNENKIYLVCGKSDIV